MRWKKYIVETTLERESAVCSILNDHGIYGLEIQDQAPVPEAIKKEGGYFEELMPDLLDDSSARVIFYVEEDQDFSEELTAIRSDLNGENILEDISDEADWRDKWKQYFHAFSIGNIHICPTWEEPEEIPEDDVLIRIDPGIAFGTGKHESTRGCIELMQKYLREGDEVLDVGFGSGILSVCALKLGAKRVRGTDIADECIEAARDNFGINGLEYEEGSFLIGDLSSNKSLRDEIGEGCYDVVCANILADIIIGMKDALSAAVRPGGVVLCAGIIDFKEPEVVAALEEAGLQILESFHMGEWCALAAKKEK